MTPDTMTDYNDKVYMSRAVYSHMENSKESEPMKVFRDFDND